MGPVVVVSLPPFSPLFSLDLSTWAARRYSPVSKYALATRKASLSLGREGGMEGGRERVENISLKRANRNEEG